MNAMTLFTRSFARNTAFVCVLLAMAAVLVVRPNVARAEHTEAAPTSHPSQAAIAPTGPEPTAPGPHVQGAAHSGEEKLELVPAPGATQIITSLVTLGVFLLLVAVLGKYAWGPIVTGLKAREDKIRKEIHDAEAARAQADATLREYNTRLAQAEQQVRDLLAKASTDAEQIAAGVRARATQEAEESKEKAIRDIEVARKQAIAEVYQQAAVIATSVAEKILQRNLNADDQRDLVNRSLEQLQSVGTN